MLLRDGTEADPFSGAGTPAALLLDADGTLAEAMSVGANQVPVLAATSPVSIRRRRTAPQ